MKLFFLTILVSFSLLSVAEAQQETHGGDGFAMEFLQIYTELRSYLPETDIPLVDGRDFSVKSLDRIRPRLKVVSSAKVFWNGQEVSARNTPSTYLVEISQTHWQLLNFEQKISLVLHEVLPIAGWLDTDYLVSSSILKGVKIDSTSYSVTRLANALLACNTGILQTVSEGVYQSLLPQIRNDFIHLSILAACPYFLNKAVQFSSLSEVQGSCDRDENRTPFEALLRWSVSSMRPNEKNRYDQMLDIIYRGPEDNKLSCISEGAVVSQGSVCKVLKNYDRKNFSYINELVKKANCL